MKRPVDVPASPIRVAGQYFGVGRLDERLDRRAAVNDIGVGRHEPRSELRACAKERGEDVILFPSLVDDERKVRIPRSNDVRAIPSDEDHVLARKARLRERLQDPIEHRPSHDRDESIRYDIRFLSEATSTTSADDDGPHAMTTTTRRAICAPLAHGP